jgi:hypothetical protein
MCVLLPPAAAHPAGFQKLTDKKGFKKYMNSIGVLTEPSVLQDLQAELRAQQQRGTFKRFYRTSTWLLTWLESRFDSTQYKLEAKGGSYATNEHKVLAGELAAEKARGALRKRALQRQAALEAQDGLASYTGSSSSGYGGGSFPGLVGVGPDGRIISAVF